MGTKKAGRKPRPSAMKKLQGETRPCRTNDNEPLPLVITGAECPASIVEDEVARKTWEWVIPVLRDMRVLTVADVLTVEQFCTVVANLRNVQDNLRDHGMIQYVEKMAEDGNKYYEAKRNPLVTTLTALHAKYISYASELGLTPASRAKLKVEDAKAKDGFEEMLGGGK